MDDDKLEINIATNCTHLIYTVRNSSRIFFELFFGNPKAHTKVTFVDSWVFPIYGKLLSAITNEFQH